MQLASDIDDFPAIAAKAAATAKDNGIALSEATVSNFAVLGITAGDTGTQRPEE